MSNLQFMHQYQQVNSIQSKNEMLFLIGGTVIITGLLAYSYHLQTQKLIAKNYIIASHVNVMYRQKEAALEAKEIAEAQVLHYKNELEKLKQQANTKGQIR